MAQKAIFLDRDDTIIRDPGYINHPDQVKLISGVAASLAEFHNMGYKLVVVTNQSAVARGIVTEKVLSEINDRLVELLSSDGVELDGIYYCPYHPDGIIPKYRKESELRKPNPGMLLQAAREMDIDIDSSWMIGNSERDVKAGHRAGCRTILLDNPVHAHGKSLVGTKPDFRAVNMKEAVNIVKKYQNRERKPDAVAQEIPLKATQEQLPQTQSLSPDTDQNEQVLEAILDQLKLMQKINLYDEFSVMRTVSGAIQVIAVFCLIVGLGFLLLSSGSKDMVVIMLLLAMVMQTMSLTFYIMNNRK